MTETQSQKAVFLDRDGTIVDDPGYLNDPDQLKLLPGAARAINDIRSLGYKLVLITNQSAVARGIASEETIGKIHERLSQMLAHENAWLDGIYYCPYHPDGVIPQYRKEDFTRKPNPGMILAAAEQLNLDLENSWMIGDGHRDTEAGRRAGCRTILITHSQPVPPVPPGQQPADFKAVNITEAANIIKHQHRLGQKPKSPPPPKTEPQPEKPPAKADPLAEMRAKEAMLDAQALTTPAQEPAENSKADAPKPISTPSEQKAEKMPQPTKHGKTQIRAPEVDPENESTNQLLRKILDQLKADQRQEMFDEFSVTRFIAGVIQIGVFFCLLVSVWLLLGAEKQADMILVALAYAVVLQLMALTFYMIKER